MDRQNLLSRRRFLADLTCIAGVLGLVAGLTAQGGAAPEPSPTPKKKPKLKPTADKTPLPNPVKPTNDRPLPGAPPPFVRSPVPEPIPKP